MECNLNNKTALISGASQGIGFAIAKLFAKNGANVILLARNKSKLEYNKQELDKISKNNNFNNIHYILDLDLNNLDILDNKLKQQLNITPNIDIIINNSGGPAPGPANLANIQDYLSAFTNHLLANQIIIKNILPSMQKNKFGRIINIISTSVKQPIFGLGVSNTIRGAVANWAKTLSVELGPYNITVNNILPGATETDRLKQIFENKAKKLNLTLEQIIEKERNAIPLKRFATPEEIAAAALFLASNLASYINGINLPVDGGRTQCL